MVEDKELFELCKEVYKKTGWSPKIGVTKWLLQNEFFEWSIIDLAAIHNPSYPLYTSDYLLEKLEEKYYQLRLEHNHSDMQWYAYFAGKQLRYLFDNEDDWNIRADTPLKTLLKLVIALNDAGVKL